jgi:hypothetical protein
MPQRPSTSSNRSRPEEEPAGLVGFRATDLGEQIEGFPAVALRRREIAGVVQRGSERSKCAGEAETVSGLVVEVYRPPCVVEGLGMVAERA